MWNDDMSDSFVHENWFYLDDIGSFYFDNAFYRSIGTKKQLTECLTNNDVESLDRAISQKRLHDCIADVLLDNGLLNSNSHLTIEILINKLMNMQESGELLLYTLTYHLIDEFEPLIWYQWIDDFADAVVTRLGRSDMLRDVEISIH